MCDLTSNHKSQNILKFLAISKTASLDEIVESLNFLRVLCQIVLPTANPINPLVFAAVDSQRLIVSLSSPRPKIIMPTSSLEFAGPERQFFDSQLLKWYLLLSKFEALHLAFEFP